MAEDAERLRELVAEVAAAYFSNSQVSPGEIPTVIQQITDSLGAVGAPKARASSEPERPKLTAAQIRKSITPDALISFEDNKLYKTLKRPLATRGLSLAQYREKWGLPSDYPSVAPNYSAARSKLAKIIGLGASGTKSRPAAPPATAPAKRRGRPKKDSAPGAPPATPATEAAPAKRRGRPKKDRTAGAPAADTPPVKRPGRPKSKRGAAASPAAATSADAAPAKRRGRPKKKT